MTSQEMSDALTRLGWSAAELQRRLGLSRHQTVRRWLRGEPIPPAVAAWLRQCLTDPDTPPPDDWH